MYPLQGASFLGTPLQGGILKPPALRVVADFVLYLTMALQRHCLLCASNSGRDDKQNPRNARRNVLPTERIDWPLLMRREHLRCALIELMQITHTPSRSNGVFHRPPEAFYRIEVVTAVGR